ncbi:MAG TPA: hypothetical protein VIV59_01790 [Anaeromyxobacteraceae bacterium]
MAPTPSAGRRVFATLPWKGAFLLDARVDRRGAPHFDEVTLSVVWPGGQHGIVAFRDCWAFQGRMGLGSGAPEAVRGAWASAAGRPRRPWAALSAPGDGLMAFTVELNSGGRLKVYAREWASRALGLR